MKLVLAVAALALVASSAYAKCGTSETETDTFDEGNVGICTWYKDESCCNYSKAQEEAQEKSLDDPVCEKGSDGCLEISRLISCISCSPEQASWTDKEGKVTFCKSLADRWYGACKEDEYNNLPDGTKTKNCVKIGEEWESGTDFVEAIGDGKAFTVAEDNKDCFNSASSLVASAAVVAAAVVALF